MGIGSFIGAYFGGAFNSLIGVFIALAAGTMMYVVLEEIFPKSRSLYCIIAADFQVNRNLDRRNYGQIRMHRLWLYL